MTIVDDSRILINNGWRIFVRSRMSWGASFASMASWKAWISAPAEKNLPSPVMTIPLISESFNPLSIALAMIGNDSLENKQRSVRLDAAKHIGEVSSVALLQGNGQRLQQNLFVLNRMNFAL